MIKLKSISYFFIVLLISTFLFGQNAQEQQAYSYAVQLQQDGLYDIAIEQYQQYLNEYPRGSHRAEAALQIGEAHSQLGNYRQALKAYLQVDLDFPGTDQALDALWSAGEAYETMGQYAEAARAFNRLYMYYPENDRAPRALIRGAQNAEKGGDPDLASDLLHSVIQDYYQTDHVITARIQLAKLYRNQMEYQLAWNEIDKALNASPGNEQRGQLLLAQARTAENLFGVERAEEIYARIRNDFQEQSLGTRAALELGRLAILQKDFSRGEQFFSQLEESDDSELQVKAAEYHGDLFWQQQNYEDAKSYYMNALNMDPPLQERQILYLKSALAAERMGDNANAFQQLQTLTDTSITGKVDDSLIRVAYDHLADAALAIDRPRDALVALNDLMKYVEESRYPSIYHRIGNVYFDHLGDYEAAARNYKTVIDSFPRYDAIDEVFFAQGKAYLQSEQIASSKQTFQWLIDGYPYSSYRNDAEDNIWFIEHFKSDHSRQSFQSLASLVGDMLMGGDSQELYFRLAKIFYQEQQNYETGIQYFQSLLEESPSTALHDSLQWYLAESYRILGRGEKFLQNSERHEFYHDRAVANYTELFGRQSDNSQLRTQVVSRLGEIYLSESPKEAVSFLTQQRTSENPELRIMLARAYRDTGQPEEALTVLSGLLSSSQVMQNYPEVIALAADINRESGDRDKARDLYSQYYEIAPSGKQAAAARWALLQSVVATEDFEQAESYAEDLRREAFYTRYYDLASNEIGQIYMKTSRYSEAAQWYAQLAESENTLNQLFIGSEEVKDTEAIYWAGQAYKHAGQDGVAEKYFRWYTYEGQNSQRQVDAYQFLAELAVGKKSYENARDYLLGASEIIGEEDAETANNLKIRAAEMLFKLEQYSDAEEEMFGLVREISPPRKYEVWEQAIIAQIRNDRISQANEQIEKLREAASLRRNSEVLKRFDFEKAKVLASDKQYQDSVPLLQEVLKGRISDEFALEVKYVLSNQYRVTNKHEEAIKLIGEIVSENPESDMTPAAYVTLGTIYAEMERPGDAVEALRKALNSGAKGSVKQSAMNNLMALYNSGGLYKNALDMARQYLDEFPNAEDAFDTKIQMGNYLINNREYERAIDHFSSLLQQADAETAAEIQYNIGIAYFEQNKFKQAITEFLKVPYLSPPTKLDWSATALWKAGNAYEQLDLNDNAILLYERIITEEGASSNYGRFARRRINELTTQGGNPPQ